MNARALIPLIAGLGIGALALILGIAVSSFIFSSFHYLGPLADQFNRRRRKGAHVWKGDSPPLGFRLLIQAIRLPHTLSQKRHPLEVSHVCFLPLGAAA